MARQARGLRLSQVKEEVSEVRENVNVGQVVSLEQLEVCSS